MSIVSAPPTGEDWFMHFQDVGAYGRVVHLQPMKWIDDWQNIQEVNGTKVIKFCAAMIPADTVKNIAFQLRGEITENLFFVAGTVFEGKPMLTVMLSDNLVAGGLKAGNLVKEAAKLIQGGGGGQPHFATAGGKNPDGLNAALDKVLERAGL